MKKFVRNILNFVFVFATFILPKFAISQVNSELGMPFLINYQDEKYPLINDQVWAIEQDNNGIIYIGSNNGLFEFDGFSFRHYKIGDDLTIRSLAFDKEIGRLYVGASSEFGYMKINNNGNKEYICLSDSLSDLDIKATWKIYVTKSGIYFQINRNSFARYFNNIVSLIDNKDITSEFRSFEINDTILISDLLNGFLTINQDKFEKLDYGFEVTQNDIRAIIQETDTTLLVFTTLNGVYRWKTTDFCGNNHTFTPIDCEASTYLNENLVYFGTKNKNYYVIATLSGGIVILDKNLQIKHIFKKDKGLLTNGVYYIFNDFDKNLWIGSEKGISQLDINSPFKSFSDVNGLIGTVSSFNRFNNILFTGTYDGIYYLKNRNFNKIDSKEIFIGQLLKLQENDKEYLIGASLRNIFQIHDTTKIDTIIQLYGCFSMIKSNKTEKRIFFGHDNGLSFGDYEIDNEKIQIHNYQNIEEITNTIYKLNYDKYGNLWASTSNNGLFVVEFKDTEDEYTIHKFDTIAGLPSNIGNIAYNYKDEIVIASRDGLLTIENSNEPYKNYKFLKNNIFRFNFQHDSISFYSMSVDNKDNIWFVTSEGVFKYFADSKKLTSSQFKNLNGIQKDNIIYCDNDITWIGIKDKIYSYNDSLNVKHEISKQLIIRKVKTKNEIIYFGSKIENELFTKEKNVIKYNKKIDYQENTISFEFSLPFFQSSNPNIYSTYLEGYSEEWTEWDSKNEVIFTNLHEGKYTFYVKAKNIYDEKSEIIGFEFVIRSPWYRSIIAIIVYVIILIILIQLILIYRTKKILKAKKELEEIIKQRTAEIEQQKEEINKQAYELSKQKEELASRTEELSLINNELKHLSLVAHETENSVVLLDKRGRFEWWNKGFTRLFNYRFQKYNDADFRTKQKLLRPDLQREIKNYTKEKGTVQYTAHDVFENGEEIWYQTTLNPVFDESGNIFQFVAIDFDITKHKLSEIEINRQKEEIQNQAEKLRYINIELSKQRNKIERQNKEITDSILYAKRIQEAMLPLPIFIDFVLPDNFILFKPRDIVSGDFYWIFYKNKRAIIAVADCTGHGIPGAFMSLLGISALKEIVNRLDIITSDEILNILREQIMITLHQRGKQGEATDGMDIALCVYEEENNKLQFSGANNPLYIIRKQHNNYSLIRYKPDKMPIGIHYNVNRSFTRYEIDLLSDDTIYLFTDGYVDQFGEMEDKKFLAKNFKTLLLSIQNKSMQEQKEILSETIEKWKGRRQQVDDILVMGIRFNKFLY